MFRLFDQNHHAELNVLSDEISIRKAAGDLLRDLIALSGNEDFNGHRKAMQCARSLTDFPEADGEKILISVDPGLPGPEGYRVTVSPGEIRIAGSDPLGTIYGIYDFEKNFLKLDPNHRFTDFFPEKKKEMFLPEGEIRKGAPTVRFRGWFLNDEDLLCEFRGGGGERNLPYRFYNYVIAEDVLDMVLETALRNGYNFIIPATFVNIMNPPEERLVRQSYERGLYISQHHIEPLGVSHFAANAYMKQAGIPGAFSFLTNRENTEAVWKAFIEAWRPYSDRVIWQLGLRGATDVPVWVTEGNIPDTDEAHGAIISEALSTEARLLTEAFGPRFLSTMTLWHEGANLYKQGLIRIPEGTTVVFSDVGFDQMYSNDFYLIERRPDTTYGVYQHCAFYSKGPHNAEGVEPRKMVYSTVEAYTHGSLYYTVLNVTNVRPMVNSIALHAALLKDPSAWTAPEGTDFASDDSYTAGLINDYLEKFYAFYFGDCGHSVKLFRDRYYGAMADLGLSEAKLNYHRHAFDFHDVENLPFRRFPASDGEILYWGKSPYRKGGLTLYPHPIYDWTRDEFLRSAEEFDALREELSAYRETIAEKAPGALAYYDTNLCFQTDYMRLLTHWVLEIRKIQDSRFLEKRLPAGERAVGYLEELLLVRGVMEKDSWKGWWVGDKKHDIAKHIPMTRAYAKEGNIINLEKYQ